MSPSSRHSYKNELQIYTQNLNMQPPRYETIKLGPLHLPKFKAIVYVGDGTFLTRTLSPSKKAAEEDAARLALTSLVPPVPPLEVPSFSCSYKNMLQEFCQKRGFELPLYQSLNEGQIHAPRFRSTVFACGKSYTSQGVFSQKRPAEQDAARVALLELRNNPGL